MSTMEVKPYGKTADVILVEDDDGDAKAIRRAFLKARIANPVHRFVDGIEALAFLRGETDMAPPISFVLLVDIKMPRMNGIEFVAALRQDPRLRKSIAFMLSTSDNDRDVSAAYDLNVAGYILKQNAGREFLELISTLDHFWRIVDLPEIEDIRTS